MIGDSMKNKQGFTLSEILGVIVILGLLVLLLAPGLINRISSSRKKAEDAGNEIVYSAVQQHINDNKKAYPSGNQYCIPISKLIADGKLVSPVINVVTGENIENKSVLAQIQQSGSMEFFIMDSDECKEEAKLKLIEFELRPSEDQKWSRSRTVIIKYPENGSEHQYAVINGKGELTEGSWKNATGLSENKKEVEFTEAGYIYARMKYENGKVLKVRKFVGGIDRKAPVVNSACTASNAKVDITDQPDGQSNRSGIKQYQILEDDVVKKTQNVSPARTDTITFNYAITSGKKYKVKAIDGVGNESEAILCFENPISVTFNPNGGTVSPTLKIYDGGKKYSAVSGGEFPTPTKAGYSSAGWYTKESGGTKVTTDTVASKSDHTLYAHWTANKYTVTLDANEGTVNPTSMQVTYAGTYSGLPTPTRSSYTFAGWYTAKTGGTKVTSSTKVTKTVNHTLYAQWTLACETRIENGQKVTGWKKVGSNWYYYDKDGCMVKGWITDSSSTSCASKKYYTNTSGVMQTGWQSIGGYWYYFDSSGCMLTGWIQDNNSTSCPSRWYYANSSGQMQKGWQKISNKWYYLAKGTSAEAKWQSKRPEGCMMTGWVYSEDYSCRTHGWYFNSSGALATSTTIDDKYWVDGSGCWTQTWDSCVSGGYYQGGYVWDSTAGGWHDGWWEAGEKCYPGYNQPLCQEINGSFNNGYCCLYSSRATWHDGYYTGASVWSDHATWIPCSGGWVSA